MASIVRYQPFRMPVSAVSRDLDSAFERLFDDVFGTSRAARPQSSANLYETKDAFLVELPLPGVRPDDVELTIQENVLSLRAKREWQAPENASAIWHGFGSGEWRQSFTLPGEVNPERVTASMEHGVLRLELAKAEHIKPRTIRINGAGRQATIESPERASDEAGDQA